MATELQGWPYLHPSEEGFTMPQGAQEPVDGLPLHTDGMQCQIQPDICQYIVRSPGALQVHWRKVHQWQATHRGGFRTPQQQRAIAQQRADAYRPVWCQRFFHHGAGASFFEVTKLAHLAPAEDKEQRPGEEEEEFLLHAVLADLAEKERNSGTGTTVVQKSMHRQEISPWLDLTRINSSLPEPRLGTPPLMVKLQKGTWRKYLNVWKALLCFVYRTADANCAIMLEHRFTSRQAACLNRAMEQAATLCQAQSTDMAAACSSAAIVAVEGAADRLDRTCLDLCISLLDHELKGPVYESVIVGFLAALGIDPVKETLREAYCYSPMLAAFMKIARMLVIQKAVLAA